MADSDKRPLSALLRYGKCDPSSAFRQPPFDTRCDTVQYCSNARYKCLPLTIVRSWKPPFPYTAASESFFCITFFSLEIKSS